jgi:outer membrane lipoprotein-sorting protein
MVFSAPDGSSAVYMVWVRGESERIEINVKDPSGEEESMVVIINQDYTYLYTPAENTAIRYPSGPDNPAFGIKSVADIFIESYLGYGSEAEILASIEQDCEDCRSVSIIGHENIIGEECTIFEVVMVDGTNQKVWFVTDKGYILKIEVKTPEGTTTVEFSDIDFSPSIPDSVFVIPEGVQIQDMPGF